jgi:hypothetical protein
MSGSAAPSRPRPDRTGTWFADERGMERRLKVSWHPERRILVLSIWQGDTCATTFRLPVADVPRLVSSLVEALGQAAASHPLAGTAARARHRLPWPPTRWRPGRPRA